MSSVSVRRNTAPISSIRAVAGARVRVAGLRVNNAGWIAQSTDGRDVAEATAIRGFEFARSATHELNFDAPGDYVVGPAD